MDGLLEPLAISAPDVAVRQLATLRTVFSVVLLFSATMLAGLLVYVAFRVGRAGQWPPPGWRVIWQTPIRTGRQAAVVVALMLTFAVVSVAYGVTLMKVLWAEPGEPTGPSIEV